MMHDMKCRICGGEIIRTASGKGRVPDYHPACKVVAQAVVNLERGLDEVEFAEAGRAQALRGTLYGIVNRIPANWQRGRAEGGRFVAANGNGKREVAEDAAPHLRIRLA